MSEHIPPIDLERLQDPIRRALGHYARQGDGHDSSQEITAAFDIERATRLEPTPDEPFAASSTSLIRYGYGPGDPNSLAATLQIVVLGSGDGTGREEGPLWGHPMPQLEKLDTGSYPRSTKIVPRYISTYSELWFSVSSVMTDPTADPQLFAGNCAVLGLEGYNVIKLDELGQPLETFQQVMDGTQEAEPAAVLTRGYYGALNSGVDGLYTGDRFGELGAVFNPHRVTQVYGRIALKSFDTPLARFFGAREPEPRQSSPAAVHARS